MPRAPPGSLRAAFPALRQVSAVFQAKPLNNPFSFSPPLTNTVVSGEERSSERHVHRFALAVIHARRRHDILFSMAFFPEFSADVSTCNPVMFLLWASLAQIPAPRKSVGVSFLLLNERLRGIMFLLAFPSILPGYR